MPRLKTMTWDMANPEAEFVDPVAVINLKVLIWFCIMWKCEVLCLVIVVSICAASK